jgi:hypothetical protein
MFLILIRQNYACSTCTATCPLARGVVGGNMAVSPCPSCGSDCFLRRSKVSSLFWEPSLVLKRIISL